MYLECCQTTLHTSLTVPSCVQVQEAEAAEQANPPMVATCQAIVKEVIEIGVEEEDRKRTWKADAEVLPRLHCTNEGLRP